MRGQTTRILNLMASDTKIYEGVFAINKPTSISSAQVLRDLQRHFNPSSLFAPWLEHARAKRTQESRFQRQRRREKGRIQVKLGHGGTLDPLATGVLITGVGSGTKALSRFLECTKSYEAVVLFGAATDTYDTEGKVVARAPYSHVTREAVEAALQKFRGKGMQRPPVFSALRVGGKRLYEYAREGGAIPEIKEREVDVLELELVEWMEPGTHGYKWPEREAEKVEKEAASKLMNMEEVEGISLKTPPPDEQPNTVVSDSPDLKRKREEGSVDETTDDAAKKLKSDTDTNTERTSTAPQPQLADSIPYQLPELASVSTPAPQPQIQPQPPAARLRMTVTSGFYVRSLCHDLGPAVKSLGIMAALVRTRQGDFELRKNVLEYDDLAKGEEVWGEKVKGMLEEWDEKENGGDRRSRSRSREREADIE
ncbi:pseudouridine synthase [Patellaria atrata CBS 101060]|uniref:tRNA pseudouridine(55) synthase n=1 Tax=Patellaria atrata CBS 101060 TaxID=1346257 RepID=A0A9P4S4G1_9PEZI|nr:pseudouridine synthase [Patellaria atrata CBS 101060]